MLQEMLEWVSTRDTTEYDITKGYILYATKPGADECGIYGLFGKIIAKTDRQWEDTHAGQGA